MQINMDIANPYIYVSDMLCLTMFRIVIHLPRQIRDAPTWVLGWRRDMDRWKERQTRTQEAEAEEDQTVISPHACSAGSPEDIF